VASGQIDSWGGPVESRPAPASTTAPPACSWTGQRRRRWASALDIAAYEGLHPGTCRRVLQLLRRGLHEVARRRGDRSTHAAVAGDLGGAQRIDDEDRKSVVEGKRRGYGGVWTS